MTKLKSYYILRFYFLLPLLYLFYVPQVDNADMQQYMWEYDLQTGRFEPAFDLLINLFKLFEFEFLVFWFALLLLQLVLLPKLYTSYSLVLFSIPSLVYLSDHFHGTQIRFAIGSLIVISMFANWDKLSKNSRVFLFFLGVAFHFGTVVLLVPLLGAVYVHNATGRSLKKRRLLLLLFSFVLINFISSEIVSYILTFNRFSYYIGSKYLEPKSISSLIYVYLNFATVIFAIVFSVTSARVDLSSPIWRMVFMYVTLLAFVIVFKDFSVISGRATKVSFLLEPYATIAFFASRVSVLQWMSIVFTLVTFAKFLSYI